MSRRRSDTLHTQIGKYGMVPLWVLERCTDPRAIQLYALLLAKWANTEGLCWPDRRKAIVPAMQTSLRNVDRAIAALKDIGALETKLKHRANGAVAGMDFWVIQIDPRLTATSGNKGESFQNAADGNKVGPILPATGGAKVANQNATGADLPATGGSHLKEEPDPDNQIQERLSTAAPPTHTPSLSSELPATPSRTLLDDYHDAYLARFETKPVIHGGKDGKLLKDLAEQVGDDAVRLMLLEHDGRPGWFFRTADPFINSTGFTVGVFVSCFNKLQLTARPARSADAAAAHVSEMADMRARSDAKQAELEQQAREALVSASTDIRERVRRDVMADLTSQFPGIDQRMPPERWAHSVKAGMVRFVVDTARREQQTPAQVLAMYLAKEPAA